MYGFFLKHLLMKTQDHPRNEEQISDSVTERLKGVFLMRTGVKRRHQRCTQHEQQQITSHRTSLAKRFAEKQPNRDSG